MCLTLQHLFWCHSEQILPAGWISDAADSSSLVLLKQTTNSALQKSQINTNVSCRCRGFNTNITIYKCFSMFFLHLLTSVSTAALQKQLGHCWVFFVSNFGPFNSERDLHASSTSLCTAEPISVLSVATEAVSDCCSGEKRKKVGSQSKRRNARLVYNGCC